MAVHRLSVPLDLPRAFFALLTCWPLASAQSAFTSSNLPIVLIDTRGRTIVNMPRIVADMKVVSNPQGQRNDVRGPFNGYSGRISIEIRGSSGQWQGWPKQHYGFWTEDSTGAHLNVSLLGLPAEHDWILYPPYNDKTLMRNVLAYELAGQFGRYAPRTRYCEVVLNGDYRGIYVLTEKVKRDRHRVDIAELRPQDTTGDQITGGYMLQVDRTELLGPVLWFNSSIVPDAPMVQARYIYYDPDGLELNSRQKQYINAWMTSFEQAMMGPSWQTQGLPRFNVDAFVDYYIINEFSRNIDCYTFSTFMYKDRDGADARLTMGPVWDFDLGFGNADHADGWMDSGWVLLGKYAIGDRIPSWLEPIVKDAGVQRRIATRWQALRQMALSLERVNAAIDAQVALLQEAQQRNFARWPVLGVKLWPNYFVGNTYEEEIAYLKDWIAGRTAWLDAQFARSAASRPAPVRRAAGTARSVCSRVAGGRVAVEVDLEDACSVKAEALDLAGRRCWSASAVAAGPGRVRLIIPSSVKPALVRVVGGGAVSTLRVAAKP